MNTTTRIGKIARLPHSIREQLNLKLHDALPAKSILPWLNSLPEAKSILAAEFDNRPITKQNLSDWKHGGFRDWLLQFNAANFLLDSSSFSSSIPPTEMRNTTDQPQNLPDSLTHHASRITDTQQAPHPTPNGSAFPIPHPSFIHKLLLWTQLQYVAMARSIDAETDPDRKWTALRHFANDISRLKRSSLADDYLQIQQDWLALSQSNTSEKKEIEFCKWIKRPDIADAIKRKKRGATKELWEKVEADMCLFDCEPVLAEHMAQVRLARELMARRKAQEAEAKRRPGDPAPEPPDMTLRNTTLEELLPFIPEGLHPDLEPKPEPSTAAVPQRPSPPTHHNPSDPPNPSYRSDPSHPSDPSDPSNSVQPSQGQSSQIQPNPPTPPPSDDPI